ncbi:unnamed protein product [Lactuca saligna]|uniref:F-box domain-containing protein n=1 Tax=Lactuca saligna TaxID=75948 RepID=A0AA35YZ61_LACSI|nr:unnamed protein product [Lactuca saligna]
MNSNFAALICKDILRTIFEKLPVVDLARSACVCRLWSSVASDREIQVRAFKAPWKLRKHVMLFSIHIAQPPHSSLSMLQSQIHTTVKITALLHTPTSISFHILEPHLRTGSVSIPNMVPLKKEYMLKEEFRLSSITTEDSVPERKALNRIKFEIPYFLQFQEYREPLLWCKRRCCIISYPCPFYYCSRRSSQSDMEANLFKLMERRGYGQEYINRYKMITSYFCMWHNMCWKVNNCYPAWSKAKLSKCFTGLTVSLKNQIRVTFAAGPSSLEEDLDRVKSFCQKHSHQQKAIFLVVPFVLQLLY